MWLEGGLYALSFALLWLPLWCFWSAYSSRSWNPLKFLLLSGMLALGVCGITLLPVSAHLGADLSREIAPERVPVELLVSIFFGEQSLVHSGTDLPWMWHEYGHYIGPFGFIILLVGVVRSKQNRFWVLGFVLFFVLALGALGPYSPWELIHRLPIYEKLRASGRFFHMAILALAVVAAAGLNSLGTPLKLLNACLLMDLLRVGRLL